ncbi:hypothetical protein B7494_g874 [Chlorociboria aeruginascens]|nr:hypothetical protein B7494_g874 [Chlorociboria aeruginascens]
MSFGIGCGDLIAISTLAWSLYKNCRESSEEFRRISGEVASLHVVLKETEEYLAESRGLSPSRDARLAILIDGCKDILADLTRLVNAYESLGTQAQRTWDRMRWGLEDLADVRSRIISNTTMLTAFNSSLASSSTARIEKRLNKFIVEIRSGLREGSVVTTSTVAETIDSDDVWQQLRRELEDVGISSSVIEENHAYITGWLKTAIQNGMLEELDPTKDILVQNHGSIDSGYGGSVGAPSSYTPSLVPMTVANEEFETQVAQRPSRSAEARSSSTQNPPIQVRKASNVSSVIFKLFKKDTAIIEAASDGDTAKVAKLISLGANVNARDRWGWSALSMCGYGGHMEICRMLLDHGADLDNVDVDGDTPESLATNRGHADIVIMLDEERAARDLKAREGDLEKPRRSAYHSIEVYLDKAVVSIYWTVQMFVLSVRHLSQYIKYIVPSEYLSETSAFLCLTQPVVSDGGTMLFEELAMPCSIKYFTVSLLLLLLNAAIYSAALGMVAISGSVSFDYLWKQFGAGISGLRCAEILLEKGYQVTILEARDRIGGRHASGDHHPIRDLAISTGTPLHYWNTKQNIYTSSGTLLSDFKSSELSTLLWKIIEEAFEYSEKNGKSIPETKSLYDFVKQRASEIFKDNEEDRELLLQMSEMWGAYIGHPVWRQSLRFSWMEECCGGEEMFIETTYEKMLAEISKCPLEKANIRLGEKVVQVQTPETREEGRISLLTENGETIFADEVLMTTPLGWLKRHRDNFKPSLPQRIIAGIDAISVGHLEKVFITFPSAFWTENSSDDFAGYTNWLPPTYAPETNPKQWPQEIWNLAAFTPENRHPTILFYTYGDCSEYLTTLVHAKSPEEHDELLNAFFLPYYSLLPNFSPENKNCIPKAILSTEWQKDELSGYGSYCNFQVGIKEADEDVKAIRHGCPERRLWFAGEHTAPFEELGTAAGAYMSGEAVGKRMLELYKN